MVKLHAELILPAALAPVLLVHELDLTLASTLSASSIISLVENTCLRLPNRVVGWTKLI